MNKMIDLNYIKTGDVLLIHNPLSFNPVTWLSWCIRKFTKSYYNHTGTFVIDSDNLIWFYEATENGYVRNLAKTKFKDRDVKYFKLKRYKYPLNYSAIESVNQKLLGVKYDYPGTLFFQLIKQISKNRKWYQPITNSLRRLYCSEASAYSIFIGSDGKDFKNYFETAPIDIDLEECMGDVEIKTITF